MNGKKVIAVTLISSILGILWKRYYETQLQALKSENEKLSDNYQLLNHWLEIRNEGRSVAEYFEHMGYRHIAVYGMAELANRLSEELENSDIQIVYGIDKDVCCTIARIEDVYSLQEELPRADVIVVTPYYAFETICRNLKQKTDCPIISIEDVIWSV
jgi:hypothetical protein